MARYLLILLLTILLAGCQGGHGQNLQKNTININIHPLPPDWGAGLYPD